MGYKLEVSFGYECIGVGCTNEISKEESKRGSVVNSVGVCYSCAERLRKEKQNN